MKSDVSSGAPKSQGNLKGILLNPPPSEAAKNFPGEEVEMIASKVGDEFSHLCGDTQKQKDLNGSRPTQEAIVVSKKRKSQQAGPSYAPNCGGKETPPILGTRRHLDTQSEDNDSSFSDCASSPSSSLHFGDSDTETSDEDKEAAPVRQARAVFNASGRIHGSRPQKWPRTEADSVSGILLKRPCFHNSSSRRRLPYRKRFVKTSSAQRTQNQKERILMQRKKREVLARQKYALLPSSSSTTENDLSSASSSSSSTEGEEELFVSAGENHQTSTAVPSGKDAAPGLPGRTLPNRLPPSLVSACTGKGELTERACVRIAISQPWQPPEAWAHAGWGILGADVHTLLPRLGDAVLGGLLP